MLLNEQQQQDPSLLNHAQLIMRPSRGVAREFCRFLNMFYNYEGCLLTEFYAAHNSEIAQITYTSQNIQNIQNQHVIIYILYIIYTYKRHIRFRGNKQEKNSLSNSLKRNNAKHTKKEIG